MDDKALLTLDEAGTYLSIGRSKLYELISEGAIRTVRIGRSVRVPAEELRSFVNRLSELAVAGQ